MSGSRLNDVGPNQGQRIDLTDGRPSSIHDFEVFINQSQRSQQGLESSPKIQVNTITGQNWQSTGYYGNMIACSNDYLAYILESRNGYCVRIIQMKTKDRALLKNFTGKICELSFVHPNSNVLGIVDQAGNIHIYDLDIAHGDVAKMGTTDKLKIYSECNADDRQHRLTWCPIVNEDDVNDNLVVAVSNGNRAEVYDVNEIRNEYSAGIVQGPKLKHGKSVIEHAHDDDICDLSLSPDGNVLATAGRDGHVKFWQLDMEGGNPPVRLHDYIPHGGKPVTRLIFCDDHLSKDPKKQFWRFLLTAAEDNTIIKVWCTVNWKCLQTISFEPPKLGSYPPSKMRLSLDSSASYLLVADTTGMVLYILPFHQESGIGDASFTSVTEYLLTQQVLSFIICGYTPVPLVPIDSSEEDEEEGGERAGLNPANFNPERNAVVIRLNCIQTKSLQQLQVCFEPPGIMGIPPPPATPLSPDKEVDNPQEDTPIDGNLPTTFPSSDLPPLLQGLSDLNNSTEEMFKMDDIPIPVGVTGHYAPGQSSPSVKLLSPETILNQGSSAPLSAPPSLSFPSSHVLRSPSDFESIPNSLGSSMNCNKSSNNLDNSQFVGLPLKTLSSNEDNSNEEMVLTSPSTSLPRDHNHEANLFPSAHDSTSLPVKQDNEDTPIIEDSEQEDEDWPNLSATNVGGDNNNMGGDSANMGGDNVGGDKSNDIFAVPSMEDAKDIAVSIVASAITSAIYVIDGTTEKERESHEAEGESEMERQLKVHQMRLEQLQLDYDMQENVEEAVVHSKLAIPYTPPVAMSDDEETMSEPLNISVDDDTVKRELLEGAESTATRVGGEEIAMLQSLMQLVQQQQLELHALRTQTQHAMADMQSSIKSSLDDFSTGHKSGLSQQLNDHYVRLEKLFKEKQSIDSKRLTQSLTQTINTSVSNAVSNQLERCVKSEVKKTLPTAIQRHMTTLQDQCVQIVHQKLSETDTIVRDTIARSINTQSIAECVSANVASTLHHLVQKHSEALFVNAVLPSFQSSLKEIFAQINEAFKAGMAEYLSQLQIHQAGMQDNTLRSLHTSLVGPNSSLMQGIGVMVSQEFNMMTQQLEQSLSGSISSVVKSSVEESMVASGGGTRSMKQQKDRIQALLQEKQFDMAFNLALSTSNLELVTQTCKMVGADEVFDDNAVSTLSQPVLLSLIQQLAVGLHEEIDLKMRYLEMAILSLNPEDPITSPHLPPVMQLLVEQIVKVEDQLHSSKAGSASLFRAAKRVRMLAAHVKKSSLKK